MNSFVFAMNDESGEHNAIMRVDGSVGDPILSCGGIWRVNNELIGLSIVGRGGLHFDRVVTVSKLGKPKASDTIERVDGIEKAFMNTEGVEHVDIEFEQGLVIVDTGPDTRFDEKQLEAITRDAGFTLRSWKRVDAP